MCIIRFSTYDGTSESSISPKIRSTNVYRKTSIKEYFVIIHSVDFFFIIVI